MLYRIYKLVLAVLFLCVCELQAEPVKLQVNHLDTPLGIALEAPIFSWQSAAKGKDWRQAAFQILVASDAGKLKPGSADLWDSGKVASSESINIAYKGEALRPGQHSVWMVRTWDEHGEQAASLPSWFETRAEWAASWIRRDDRRPQAELRNTQWIWLPGTNPLQTPSGAAASFRYKLHLEAQPSAASLEVIARGAFTAKVNGTQTGHHDGFNAFDYEEVGPLLHAGDNEILVEVTGKRTRDQAPVAAAFAASLQLRQANGTFLEVNTDSKWEARAAGPEQTASAPWQPAMLVGPVAEPFAGGAPLDRIVTDASLFRKDFTLGGAIVSARLTITALGAYRAYLNGTAVGGDAVLSPGWTDFHKRVLSQTYDVTSLLRAGSNALGVTLGGGWYSSPLTWNGTRFTPGPDLLRAQLDLTLADGAKRRIATDESWSAAAAPVTFAEIYAGESYDARLEQPGWNKSDFQEPSGLWSRAVAGVPPNAELAVTPQPDLPIRTVSVLSPVTAKPISSGSGTVYDMGQNMVGNVRLHVSGQQGTLLRLRYAERLNPDGSIYTTNLRNAEATDTYTLSGRGEEVWSPSFTYHGFRYVELSVIGDAALPAARIEGLVQNSIPAQPSLRLASSSELLNKMYQLGLWGERGNFVSVPTDCPQRDERLGWMGDAGVFWRTGSYNFDIDAFSQKFMDDVTDAQSAAGAFTNVAPNVLGEVGAPGWGDAGVAIPYAAWLQYGDLALAERSWPAMQRWMAFVLANNPAYLRQHALGNNFGDWLAPDPNTPKELIGTAYWALAAQQMAEMADALHHKDDARQYRDAYNHIRAAYRAAYLLPGGEVAGNTQTAYLATLFTGMATEEERPALTARLLGALQQHDVHLTTGFLGTPFLLYVLDSNHHSHLAFQLLLQDTFPSWGYMVTHGATTWWERWNGDTGDPAMNSYNHYAFGSVMSWVYRRAAGIDTDALGAGFHHLCVTPHFDARLPQLRVEYDSAYGMVATDWNGRKRRFTVTVPPNVTATVTLGSQHYQVGSGEHQFRVPQEVLRASR